MPNQDHNEFCLDSPIGYLMRGEFICVEDMCTILDGNEDIPYTPVFRVNIGDYSQSCSLCKEVVIKGKTPAWPDLFPVRMNSAAS